MYVTWEVVLVVEHEDVVETAPLQTGTKTIYRLEFSKCIIFRKAMALKREHKYHAPKVTRQNMNHTAN